LELLTWAMGDGGEPEPKHISGLPMACAGAYLDYASEMLERVLGGLVVIEAEADAAHIGRMLTREQPETLNERKLYQRGGFTYLRNAKRRRAAFEVLEGAGFIQPVIPQGGHRPRGDWKVNPLLGGAV